MKSHSLIFFTGLLLTLSSCHTPYQVASVSRTRVLIDTRYDAHPDADAEAFITPYKHDVDSIMNPVVGETARELDVYSPESPLSNLLADIMVWAGQKYHEHPDLGVYNMGGIRASLPKGIITYGDVVDMAPFDNKICFFTLNGRQLMKVFEEIAATGGQGISHGVELVITPQLQLVSARLNGEPIDPGHQYRVATIDYVAQGNDQMTAFKLGTNLVADDDPKNNSRFIIRDYFLSQQAKGQIIDAKVEGRITIKK